MKPDQLIIIAVIVTTLLILGACLGMILAAKTLLAIQQVCEPVDVQPNEQGGWCVRVGERAVGNYATPEDAARHARYNT